MSKSSRSVKEVKKRVVLPNIDHVAEDAFTPKIRIQNIVSTFNLGPRRINLKRMALAFDFIDYNPQKFAAATIRIVYPRTTALLFTSGNVVCTGGKTKLESRWAARKYVRLLQKRGMRVYLKNYKIQNIVATAFLDCAMKLREFTNDYGVYCSYEPELFPGLVFRTLKPKVVFLIFRVLFEYRIDRTDRIYRTITYRSYRPKAAMLMVPGGGSLGGRFGVGAPN